MGSGGFNRQSYVARQVSSQKKSSGALGGLLFVLFIVVLGVLGFAGYKYVEANGLPDLGLEPGAPEAEGETAASDIGTVVAKLDEIERRLARLEGSRQTTANAGSTSGTTGPAKGAESRQSSRSQGGTAPARSQSSSRQAPSTAASGREATYRGRQYDKLAGQVTANEERWDATSDRLADTVTELNEQRQESAEQRARLNKLWERFERVPVDFNLHKRDGKTRVGPVLLWLRKSDVKNHRYTLRVLVDDKWVEFKDRGLMESLEIYLRDIPVPVELLVNEISKDRIAGILAVPERLPKR
jgi:hypothetical protein